jgi:hypothetical protein
MSTIKQIRAHKKQLKHNVRDVLQYKLKKIIENEA